MASLLTDREWRQTQDPQARLDYEWDWSGWLHADEVIDTFTIVSTPLGIVVDETLNLNGIITGWLSGGVHGKVYRVTCHIVTNQGRHDDRSLTLTIRNR